MKIKAARKLIKESIKIDDFNNRLVPYEQAMKAIKIAEEKLSLALDGHNTYRKAVIAGLPPKLKLKKK